MFKCPSLWGAPSPWSPSLCPCVQTFHRVRLWRFRCRARHVSLLSRGDEDCLGSAHGGSRSGLGRPSAGTFDLNPLPRLTTHHSSIIHFVLLESYPPSSTSPSF